MLTILQGIVRRLQYVEDSKTLHFTTSLEDSVQTYSLQHSKMLDPGHLHPSSPSCFAFSKSMGLAVSISNNPPTVCLQNHLTSTRPVFIRPTASSAPVLCASFHPRKSSFFLLAFADQTVAVYDYNRIVKQAERTKNSRNTDRAEQTGEIGHVNLRQAQGEVKDKSSPTWQKASTRNGATSIAPNIHKIGGAEFLPTNRLQVAAVADNGHCYIMDFGENQQKVQIVQSWHTCASGTSLAILGAKKSEADDTSCYIAVGRDDGKVSIFNSVGHLLAEKSMDPPGAGIIDIDWIKSSPVPASLSQRKGALPSESSKDPIARAQKTLARQENGLSEKSDVGDAVTAPPRKKSLNTRGLTGKSSKDTRGPVETVPSASKKDAPSAGDAERQMPKETSKAIDWRDVTEPYSTNYMEFFSPVKPISSQKHARKSATFPKHRTKPTGSLRVQELARDSAGEVSRSISAPQLWEDMPALPHGSAPPPSIPLRAVQSKRRRVSMLKVEASATRRKSEDLRHEHLDLSKTSGNQSQTKTSIDNARYLDTDRSNQHRSSRASETRASKSKSDTTKSSQRIVSFDEPELGENLARKNIIKISVHEDLDGLHHAVATPPRKSSVKTRQQPPRKRQSSIESNILSSAKLTNTRSNLESPIKHESENCACQSPNYLHVEVARLRASMKKEMSAFQFDLKKQFLAQKLIFEEVLAKERAERRALKREVELLRREVAERDNSAPGLLIGL